ncbi:dTDP-4-dehydrorhamnose 3,5-epimerase [Aquitalea sp. FJL05]|uniref:dTDP-4-dehydrorhamnose 3,5-epimerase n=1 Tax=Aquitalea sp. FJL05 TaxID=2153366 RepID=UPI000F5B543A|nr:dTDP-4-dehydrorhamnose 3,5-epimerase [Aquitalea sp. FJL05]RQO76839.1 dTDP-4-dehydrorhamnose 3,5-epimerase [Aquitalea sp. FJL05]
MKIVDTEIPDIKIIEPTIFGDERGFFYESYNQDVFNALTGQEIDFVQDNHSRSGKDVLRGLHFQHAPYAQAKLVRCSVGEIFDVAVDIRPASPTRGKWLGVYLSAENKKQLWIPEGFAHGFLVVSSFAEVQYKTNNYYHPPSEGSLMWNDPTLVIDWPLAGHPILSEKDSKAPPFK